MKLTWHIVRKDARRLALPVGIWLTFIVVTTIWMRTSSWSDERVEVASATAWVRLMGSLTWVVWLVETAGLVALAGVLGQEDRVIGPAASWRTRPIAASRLLRAKLIAGFLLLVVAPLVVLLPVWWAIGFGSSEVLAAAGAIAGWHALLFVSALCLSALTEDLGQHVFALLTWFALVGLVTFVVPMIWDLKGVSSGAMATRAMIVWVMPWLMMPVALVCQYFTARTRVGWTLLLIGLGLTGTVQMIWRWDMGEMLPGRKPAPADRAAPVALQSLVTPANRNLPHALFLEVSGDLLRDELMVPWSGAGELRWADGATVPMRFNRGGLWGENAAMRVAGVRPSGGNLRWDMATWFGDAPDERLRSGAAVFAGDLKFARVKARVLYELPLRNGARAVNGLNVTRVIGWEETEANSLLIEERDASPWLPDVRGREGRDRAYTDSFLLVQRPLGIVKALHIQEIGRAGANGVGVTLRALQTTPPLREVGGKREEIAGWRDGAVLVKVRFEPARWFEREFSALPLTFAVETKKP